MAQNSSIEWTDHTFNPWWGCVKVSQGCANCYAQTLDGRYNAKDPHWGPNAPRRFFGEKHWNEPIKWNRDAETVGERRRVFCASMADVFEQLPTNHPDRDQMNLERCRLFRLIAQTPWLDWLLLTKRPENIIPSLRWCEAAATDGFYQFYSKWLDGNPPTNIWLGTSVENQEAADKRIPHLLEVPARVRFLSCEPLLGPVDLNPYLWPPKNFGNVPQWIHWVIVGGESGSDARPMHPERARSLRNQCNAAEVAFFMKQWGSWLPDTQRDFRLNSAIDWGLVHESGRFRLVLANGNRLLDADPAWGSGEQGTAKMDKKKAGRLLDGRTWDELPKVEVPA